MKTRMNITFILLFIALFLSCKNEDCEPNMSLNGKWKQTEVAPGQVLMGFEVEYSGIEGKLMNVSINSYKFVNGDVVWKDVINESNAVYDVNVLSRSTSGTATYSRWKCAVLTGGNEIAFTKPGGGSDMYQRWVKVE